MVWVGQDLKAHPVPPCATGREPPASLGAPSHLVLHGDGVPGHVDALDGPEGGEGLADGVLPQLVVDGAHVDPAHDGECPLPLSCHL